MTITIKSVSGIEGKRLVLAKSGPWVVHRAAFTDRGYTVTHVGTGLAACYSIRNKTRAIAAMRAMAKIPGDWNFTDSDKLSKRQKLAGKQIRAQYLDLV